MLIVTHESGWHFFYPSFVDKGDEEIAQITVTFKIFDDSFVLAMVTALLSTEWYLSAQQGMMDDPETFVGARNLSVTGKSD